MKPTAISIYRETENQWLTGLLDREHELTIQLAKLEVEIGVVRGALRARESARTRCVSQDREPKFHGGRGWNVAQQTKLPPRETPGQEAHGPIGWDRKVEPRSE
jgi:hypothetical protein